MNVNAQTDGYTCIDGKLKDMQINRNMHNNVR